ncbi:MAG: DUF2318 domain-containing protein [Oscillospiraceae bacterium]|nr:DUF2318 domain-containing protein [Oscillospiraceae bacterium]MCI1990756.1 DUF2318 domain-containing protein [Oscillospiraceae bacterium]MCI2035726.1 DUF2318 domain-containing protein [Oscillospiraceae bacterium]
MKTKKIRNVLLFSAAILVVAAGIFAFRALTAPGRPSADTGAQSGSIDAATGNLVIQKSQVTATPSFYPYQSGNIKMEVLAVRASDGSVRTAFNTCQVCYSSGRGYYQLDGDTLVCQNCGNRFTADQVEQQRGGCNPVGITREYKTETDQTITIQKKFFQQTQEIFENWKK